MDEKAAIRAFGALAQASRLRAFRLLVERGESTVPAGEIARVPLNFSACGIVRQRGSILAEADVFTHGALARCAWLRE